MSEQSLSKHLMAEWDRKETEHLNAQEALRMANHPVRVKLAKTIHEAMYIDKFCADFDTEAWDAADAVLKAFPELLK